MGIRKALALATASLIFVAGCSAPQTTASTEAVGDEVVAEQTADQRQAEYQRALSAEGIVTGFIGEPFYDKAIEDEEDALEAAQSVIDRVGGDETTILELVEIRPTETGTTYYTFRQQAGDVVVYGASVKLVVNKDHKAVGLVSAIMPNIQLESLESWEITAEQAEKVVQDFCATQTDESVRIIKDATEQTLIAIDEASSTHGYAWVVYTNNYVEEFDVGYLAHYVNADGEYLYALPVSEPGNADALAGDEADFDFDKMEQATWSGTVTKSDGTKMDVEVPVLKNPDNGDIILADGKRKILCVDYADFAFNDTISPRIEGDDGFANNEVIIYNEFINIWDFYDSIGWTGPDGNGTPTIIKMDMVNKDGDVILNACYEGRQNGFQAFAFNREEPDGECVDVMAHEFTHCLTCTTKTSNLYLNDTGAISEGMSDVLGNLIEMATAYDEKGAWVFGENEGAIRSMKDPHAFSQPEFVWDVYYGPAASEPSVANDFGGVHINCSLLNIISYKLDQAGMLPEDQLYYWMNVALALTPSTDFPQMAELLPWCMEQAGFADYVDAVKKAVDAAGLSVTNMPDVPPTGTGFVTVEMPEKPVVDASEMRLVIRSATSKDDETSATAWLGANSNVVVSAVPAGDYYVFFACFKDEDVIDRLVLTDDGWKSSKEAVPDVGKKISVVAGKTTELPNAGLAA